MKFGFVMPFGDARLAAELAETAEQAGWDGFFVWEPVWGIDAWVSLAAAAMRTSYIRLGTMLTPVARMRPWKLASETVTLDHLSGGRLTLAVGFGAVDIYKGFPEVTDRKTRAELTDEALDIITGLWKGAPFHYQGKHYQLDVPETPVGPAYPPPPLQQPRIPIWMVGAWPREKSMQRVLKYDGLLPAMMGDDGKVQMQPATPAQVQQMHAYIQQYHPNPSTFDVVVEGVTPGDRPIEAGKIVRPYQQAGATWWIEAQWSATDLDEVGERIRQGPPRNMEE